MKYLKYLLYVINFLAIFVAIVAFIGGNAAGGFVWASIAILLFLIELRNETKKKPDSK
jgi:hypothetical protein